MIFHFKRFLMAGMLFAFFLSICVFFSPVPFYQKILALLATTLLFLDFSLRSIRVDEQGVSSVYSVGQKVIFKIKSADWENIKALGANKVLPQYWSFYIFAKEKERYLVRFNHQIENYERIVELILKKVPNINLVWEAKEYLRGKGFNA